MDALCASADRIAPLQLRAHLQRLEPEVRRANAQSHHKYVYCMTCDRVMCMRSGANGCYTGHIGIVEISDASYETLRTKRPHTDRW